MDTKEEALKALPNDVVRTALLEIIENNILSKDYDLRIELGCAKGDNYIGIVHRVTIIYQKDDQGGKPQPHKFGMIIKVPPTSIIRRQQFFARPCFVREALIYDQYLPLLTEFQTSRGIIPEKNGFHEFGKCFKSLTNDLEEAVFMEDLCLKGFTMHDRFQSPSINVVKLVMRTLGKLHALSFAIKDQCPEKLAQFKGLEEVFKRNDNLFVNYINTLYEIAYDALSEEDDKKYLKHLKAFVEIKPMLKRMLELLDGTKAEPYAVVCHGDCWNNNILFKYENGQPVDVKLIDWQMARYSSPVTDLVYYIFCCTNKTLREEYYEEMLNEYYLELSAFMRRLGSDPTVLFPRKSLDDQLEQFGCFGLIMALMAIPTIVTKEDQVPDLDELSIRMDAGDEEYTKQAMQEKSPVTRARVRDVILDLVRLGYI